MYMVKRYSLLSICLTLMLSACGGGGGSSAQHSSNASIQSSALSSAQASSESSQSSELNSSSPESSSSDSSQPSSMSSQSSSTSTLVGKAMDGYLASAKVCLDLNANRLCDESEPQTLTDGGGGYTLTASADQLMSSVVLVEVIAGQTLDSDMPGTPVSQSYSLSAPPGYNYVTPLSSLITTAMGQGMSLAGAERFVLDALGLTAEELNLNSDYLASLESATGSDQTKLQNLHKVSRTLAALLAYNLQMGKAKVPANSDFSELFALVCSKIFYNLNIINHQTETAAYEGFDPAEQLVSGQIPNFALINTTGLAERIAALKAPATQFNLADAITTEGVYWFRGADWLAPERGFLTAQSHDAGAMDLTTGEFSGFSEYLVEHQGGYRLAENGQWTPVSTAVGFKQAYEDGSVDLAWLNTDGSQSALVWRKSVASAVDLTGINIKAYFASQEVAELSGWADYISPDAVFSEGAKVGSLNSSATSNQYFLWNIPAAPWVTSQYPDGFQDTANFSLDDLFVSPTELAQSETEFLQGVSPMRNQYIVQFVAEQGSTSGLAQWFRSSNNGQTIVKFYENNFEIKTVSDKRILLVDNLSPGVAEIQRHLLLTEVENVYNAKTYDYTYTGIGEGEYIPAGEQHQSQSIQFNFATEARVFNRIAGENVLANASLAETQENLQRCTDAWANNQSDFATELAKCVTPRGGPVFDYFFTGRSFKVINSDGQNQDLEASMVFAETTMTYSVPSLEFEREYNWIIDEDGDLLLTSTADAYGQGNEIIKFRMVDHDPNEMLFVKQTSYSASENYGISSIKLVFLP